VTPVVVLLIEWVLKTSHFDVKVLLRVLIISIGVMIACYGEVNFVLIGFVFQCCGIVFEATRLVMVQKLLTSKSLKMDPLCSLYYFAPVFL
jgi:hypothetical protein